MNISITKKEFDAINDVLDQVETDYEAASDPDYLKTMGESIGHVNNVLRKYKKACQKVAEFEQARFYVAERNPHLRPRDIDKMTRKLLKKIKED